jgi:hypothetical protein
VRSGCYRALRGGGHGRRNRRAEPPMVSAAGVPAVPGGQRHAWEAMGCRPLWMVATLPAIHYLGEDGCLPLSRSGPKAAQNPVESSRVPGYTGTLKVRQPTEHTADAHGGWGFTHDCFRAALRSPECCILPHGQPTRILPEVGVCKPGALIRIPTGVGKPSEHGC